MYTSRIYDNCPLRLIEPAVATLTRYHQTHSWQCSTSLALSILVLYVM